MKLRRTVALFAATAAVAALGVVGLTNALAATAGPITGIGGKCVDVEQQVVFCLK